MKKNKQAQRQNECLAARNTPRVDCDREAWVKARVTTAMKMAISAHAHALCGTDLMVLKSALDGIANGAAVAIIQALGMEPGYVNLRKVAG